MKFARYNVFTKKKRNPNVMASQLCLLHYTVSHLEHSWNLLAMLYSQRRRNPKVMALPTTSANLLQLPSHLQVMLC